MKIIVVSAVNLVVGGTLTILRDCLSYLSTLDKTEYQVYALVNNKSLVNISGIDYLEMPWPKRNWINRIWSEYVSMKRISQEIGPVYLWLSLHDTTPNVIAEKRAVYCHNPFPFYRWNLRELYLCPKIVLFSLFSYFIYLINIHKNNYVVMQQKWIRDAFAKIFKLDTQKMIVALPERKGENFIPDIQLTETYTFLYASSANSHKNFEVLCEAARSLEKEIGVGRFTVVLTLSGRENKYAQWLYRNWGDVPSIKFAGFMDRAQLYGYYNSADCFVFPSKVETWGLPISEFASTGKPMLVADRAYAYETAAGSKKTAFFDVDDPVVLKEMMRRLVNGDDGFLKPVPEMNIDEPLAYDWRELFDYLLA